MKNTAIAASEADSNSLRILEQVVRRHGFGTDDFDYASAVLELNEIVPSAIRLDADALLDAAMSRMGFCDLVAYRTIADAIASSVSVQDAIQRGSSSKLMITTQLDCLGDGWFETIAEAAKVVVADAARRSGLRCRELSVISLRNRGDAWGIDEREYEAIRQRHVLVNIGPEGQMTDIVSDLRDDHLSLEPTVDAVRFALSRTATIDVADVPDPWMLSTLAASMLDLIVDRYVVSSRIVPAIESMAASAMERKAARARAGATGSLAGRLADAKAGNKKGPEVTHPTSPRVSELSGYGPAAAWASDLAQDVEDYRAGRLGWEDVDDGVVLSGPPGTGKTIFASALAATCGLPFIPSSFAHWQGSRGGHLGDVVKAMREVFEFAALNAPCILFIDEVDSIPRRGGSRDFDDYWRAIVNALLELLDGTNRRPGIIVVAATNNADALDPALVRSGRLDRRFDIDLPDETALRGIIAHHLGGVAEDVIAPVATALAGSVSGADVARIAREARRAARRAKREVSGEDLLAIAMPPDERSDAARWRTAVHESGHAIAAFADGRIPDVLSILMTGPIGGNVRLRRDIEGMNLAAGLEREIVVILAGRAAEEVVLGDVGAGSGGMEGSDLHTATGYVSAMLAKLGFGGSLTFSDRADGVAVEAALRRLYGEALTLMRRHRDVVEELARYAVERRVLPARALREFAEARGFEVRS